MNDTMQMIHCWRKPGKPKLIELATVDIMISCSPDSAIWEGSGTFQNFPKPPNAQCESWENWDTDCQVELRVAASRKIHTQTLKWRFRDDDIFATGYESSSLLPPCCRQWRKLRKNYNEVTWADECHWVSNQRIHCLFNNLLGPNNRTTSRLHISGSLLKESTGYHRIRFTKGQLCGQLSVSWGFHGMRAATSNSCKAAVN